MRKFVIVTTQRSGSTFLWNYLNSHPDIAANGELFLAGVPWENAYRPYTEATVWRRLDHLFRRKHSVDGYLQCLFAPYAEKDAAGFKLMYDELRRFPALWAWFGRDDVHVLHLVRNNTLKLIASREAARRRNLYHSNQGAVKPVRFSLPTGKLTVQIERIERRVQQHRERLASSLHREVSYEELLGDRERCITAILDFLGVQRRINLDSELRKVNPDSLESLLENYDEVAKALAGTRYEAYLA